MMTLWSASNVGRGVITRIETLEGAVAIIQTAGGAPGPSGMISIGTVTTLAAGAQATVSNVGTSTAAIFNFGIPQGATGSGGGGGGGSGTVTSVSVTPANGVSGSVANATTTPAITLTIGAITPTSVAATGNVTGANLSGTNTGDQTSVSGNAGTATKLVTARTLAITGDLTWTSPSFDGSGNVTAAGTLATVNGNVGTFGDGLTVGTFTADAKGRVTAASAAAIAIPWAINFTAAGDGYIPARAAMTISQGNAPLGSGTVSYAKSTTAAPSTFTSTTLPATLQAGAWLKVSTTGVTGFLALDLYRSA